MFSIIIPNYNSEKWIKKLLESILHQTYKDYEIIIVDDMSTDNSVQIIKKMIGNKVACQIIELKEKRWNGGTRNVGVEHAKGEYILFLDCDDWFYSEKCLSEIAKIIKRTNADCIRLSYQAFTNKSKGKVIIRENTLKEIANSTFVAPWTKCIKRELFVPFPENTLLEDVVQHIAQIDNINSFAICNYPIVVWNRSNENAISSDTRKYTKDDKRYSSVYRNMADLLDLKCKHDYCEEQRQFRIRNYEDIIQKGDILGLINGVRS